MSEIRDLKLTYVWRNFDTLAQVPRPSGHLDGVHQFLLDSAKCADVKVYVDEAKNVVMKRPTTKGVENRKTVILQTHVDMVPQEALESRHNFKTDLIETWIDGEWVKAKNATLGADNGMDVATILAVMEDKGLKHGPIEGLIAADEETGMFGVNDLPEGELDGDILVNSDSETWGKFVIGNADGVDITAELDYKEVPANTTDKVVKVVLSGLRGGHSGLEIHEGHGNANKLVVRLIYEAICELDARLTTWHSGNMRNTIPFRAEVVLTLSKENIPMLQEMIADQKEEFIQEYRDIGNGIELTVGEVGTPTTQVPEAIQDNLIDAVYAYHNGVIRMIPSVPTVVEASSNLAIIDIESDKASFKVLAHSSNESMKAYIGETLQGCFNMAEMKVTFSGSYGGWNPDPNSEALDLLMKLYKEQNNEEGIVQVDHTGLEYSIILGRYPYLDVVSFGPIIRSPHTSTERCLTSTVEPFWSLLKKVLEEVSTR